MWRSTIRLTFPSAKHADLAKQTLEVDDELQPDKIQKTFQVQDTVLQVYGCTRVGIHQCNLTNE